MVPFCVAGDAEEIVSVPLAPVAVGAVGLVGVAGAVGVVVLSVVAGAGPAPPPQALNSRPRPATAAQVARWRVDFFMRNPLLIWCDSLKPPQSRIAPRVRPSPEKGGWRERARRVAGLALLSALLTGCTSAGYYAQAVNGHLSLMAAARPVTEVIADPQTSDALRQRLAQSQDIRRFAVSELLLPDHASSRRYADLHRPSAVWSVVAAPPDALVAKTWYLAIETRQLVDLGEQTVQVFGELLKLVEMRRSAGKDSELDVVDVRAKLEAARAHRRSA